MRKTNKLASIYFCGNEASDYAKENGYLDHATFAKAFDAVLNNDIIAKTQDVGYWEQENGLIDNSEEIEELEEKLSELDDELLMLDDAETEEISRINSEIEEIQERIEELREEEENSYNQEIYQYFIVSNNGAEIIKQYTDDPLFYNEELDMYVWGITHYGTSWSYVLTDIQLNCGYDN